MRRRTWRLLFYVGTLVLAGEHGAAADVSPRVAVTPPAPAPAVKVARVVRAKKPPRPAEPYVPAAAVTLHVLPGALGTPWVLQISNVDAMPLRLVTDARLLTLDVGQPSEDESRRRPAVVHCALPIELRPTDDDKARVLLPNVTYVETFDPRMYCFSAREAAALVPGAEVVARLGWSSTNESPPFVADGIDGGEPRSGVKELQAPAVIVPDELADDAEGGDSVRGVKVSSPVRVDAETGRHLVIEVTVENTTTRTVRLMLRPETIRFRVSSPRGVHECAWRRSPGAPIAEVFTTIAPHGKASTDVQVSALCPDGAVDEAGLYTVRASIDTTGASGRSIGLQTFDDRIVASKSSLVRIRRDRPRRP